MKIPSWQYSEPDHPGANFDALVEVYDKNMQKFRDIQGEIREILDFLELKPDQTVLEIGTGTGEFALAAAHHCAQVYAVDLSAGMLRHADNKAKSKGLNNIEFIQGGFLTYQHHSRPLDAAVSQIALHHLPDFWKQVALINIANMLKDGGKFCLRDMIYSFDIHKYEISIEDYISRASKAVSPEFAGSISAHIKNEYSTFDWIMRGMLERAGLKVEQEKYLDGFICVYFCKKTAGSKPL